VTLYLQGIVRLNWNKITSFISEREASIGPFAC